MRYPMFGPCPLVTEFVAPGGGRGYYRTAALNSMWATAPFLHNNSVGRDPIDKDGKLDPYYLTVAGRLELFEDAMDQLLNPQKRPLRVKVTSADCCLTAGLPGLRQRLISMLRDLARQVVEETLARVVADVIDQSDLDPDLRPAVRLVLQDLAGRLRPELDKLYSAQNLEKLKETVVRQVQQQLEKVIADKLKDKPAVARLLAPLKGKFQAALEAHAQDLAALFQPDLVIPKGTPINLLMNLHIGKLPYALKVYLRHKNDPRKLAEELLKLSDCPDLIDNRGHTFGSDLSPEDKRALIEYLKTL